MGNFFILFAFMGLQFKERKSTCEGLLKTAKVAVSFVIPVVFINKLDWSVYICLTRLYLMVEIRIEFII